MIVFFSKKGLYNLNEHLLIDTLCKTWGRCFCLGELLQMERTERQKQRPRVFLACCYIDFSNIFCILSLGRYHVVAVSPFGVTSKLWMPVIIREYT